MRALLTGGIKAILAIAALSTAAHWALRVQRDAPAPVPALAGIPEPMTTGSIEPRRIDRPAPAKGMEAKADLKLPEIKAAKAAAPAAGFDQMHLSALIATTAKPAARAPAKVEPKPAARIEPKPAARTAAKPEPKPDAKSQPRAEAKPVARVAAKPDAGR